ncbi:MAG: molybdopterin-dependent oxidoreductase [Aphanocapsa sp. GSE-SYN-MK-11-07L]|jgi:DMSO/TMAO reductase YedYZ molybdopterin-dependent catalytic subunit|nr:molybdopterin-dependent oxidoreductase [Aphanocapsa sp. GSE-SYN-MK-11-07L]
MSLILPQRSLSRRQLLQWSGLSGAGLLLGGCQSRFLPDKITQGSRFLTDKVGQISEPLNQKIEALMLSQQPVPEFAASEIEPDKLLINTFDTTPQIDPAQFRLTVNGEVNKPIQLSLTELQNLPLTSMVIRHVCVEGWAAIIQWGGVRLRDLIQLAQPKPGVRYVFFQSADGYYESWDIASCLHPQTLMAYQKNGQPLAIDNGAPLRLAAPIKLGYKQSKWVTGITLLSALPAQTGYWEDQGYEWFAGL